MICIFCTRLRKIKGETNANFNNQIFCQTNLYQMFLLADFIEESLHFSVNYEIES